MVDSVILGFYPTFSSSKCKMDSQEGRAAAARILRRRTQKKYAIIGTNAVGTNDNEEIGSRVDPAYWNWKSIAPQRPRTHHAQLELSLRKNFVVCLIVAIYRLLFFCFGYVSYSLQISRVFSGMQLLNINK